MPLLITSEGAPILAEQLMYDCYQSDVKRLEKRIKSYSNRRRKPENLALDQRRLEEMKRFDPRFAKFAESRSSGNSPRSEIFSELQWPCR